MSFLDTLKKLETVILGDNSKSKRENDQWRKYRKDHWKKYRVVKK